LADVGWTEQELVRRCKEGAESAYAELVRQHRQRLINLAFRLVGSREAAEDVVQETFIAAFRAMERFEPKPALAPWLNTIALRQASRAASRARFRGSTVSLDGMMDGGTASGTQPQRAPSIGLTDERATDPHAAAEAAELRRQLDGAIAALPFKQRAAVILRFVVGLDYAEAARTMDVPLNTYKSHLLRGTRQLRESLGDGLIVSAPEPPRAPEAPAERMAILVDAEGRPLDAAAFPPPETTLTPAAARVARANGNGVKPASSNPKPRPAPALFERNRPTRG
jgi:RNA polymerase sigma factor (sigma-70 family)